MNIIGKIIRNPGVTVKYVKKYAAIEWRRLRYKYLQRGRDFYRARMETALAASSVGSAAMLFQKWQQESGAAFVPSNCEVVFQSLRKDHKFMNCILRQADLVMNDSFYILYRQVDNRMGPNGHYRWFEDYVTHYEYKLTFYMDARAANRSKGTDIKRVWEMARMQYLFAPAMAFRLTGNERYAEKVKDILSDFSHQNPKYHGPNWNPSMEIGIRAANIVLALELIRDASCVDNTFIQDMIGLLVDHETAILENEENISGKTSNHYLGGILGLAAISTHLPFLKNSMRTGNYVFRALEREVCTQILEDGGDYEGSLSYHRLVGELLGFALLASRNGGHEFSEKLMEHLYSMADFTRNIMSSSHRVVQIGDNDSGRVFQLLPEDANDHSFMVDLLEALCHQAVRPDAAKGLLEVFFGLGLEFTNERPLEKQWLAQAFGLGRYSAESFDLFVGCVNAQQYGMGGHTHNDLGCFTLNYRGYEVITDPGSGNYTGDPEMRNRLRSINSHSAVMINDKEPRSSHGSGLFAWENFNGTVSLKKTATGFYAFVAQDGASVHRQFTIKDETVMVKDTLEGDVRSASMVLLFAPGVTVRLTGKNVAEINGEFGGLIIEGSWFMEVRDGEYSPHYDETVPVFTLRLTSGRKENKLTIRGL